MVAEAEALFRQLSAESKLSEPEPVALVPDSVTYAEPTYAEPVAWAPEPVAQPAPQIDIAGLVSLLETLSGENVRLRLENISLRQVEASVAEQAAQIRKLTAAKRWWQFWR
jgi:hypothetical protein